MTRRADAIARFGIFRFPDSPRSDPPTSRWSHRASRRILATANRLHALMEGEWPPAHLYARVCGGVDEADGRFARGAGGGDQGAEAGGVGNQ